MTIAGKPINKPKLGTTVAFAKFAQAFQRTFAIKAAYHYVYI